MSKRRAFSLLELLIAIAIIAVLIGILIPTIAGVRRQSKSVACQSNLRSIGQALVMYQNNNRGWVYPVMNDAFGVIGLGLNVPPHERWPMKVFKVESAPMPPTYDVAGYDMEQAGEPQYDPAPYTPPVLLCPADEKPAQAHSYVLNNHLADEGIRAGKTIRGVSSSEIVVAGEKFTNARDYYMEYGDYDRVVDPVRHGSGAGSNYLYLDGHVATRLAKEARAGIDPWDVSSR
jgi:prepilin-type N-terminal cleavage/methylation domain-containing protein/prepilin-type processing-associated H-X9-DG protein